MISLLFEFFFELLFAKFAVLVFVSETARLKLLPVTLKISVGSELIQIVGDVGTHTCSLIE